VRKGRLPPIPVNASKGQRKRWRVKRRKEEACELEEGGGEEHAWAFEGSIGEQQPWTSETFAHTNNGKVFGSAEGSTSLSGEDIPHTQNTEVTVEGSTSLPGEDISLTQNTEAMPQPGSPHVQTQGMSMPDHQMDLLPEQNTNSRSPHDTVPPMSTDFVSQPQPERLASNDDQTLSVEVRNPPTSPQAPQDTVPPMSTDSVSQPQPERLASNDGQTLSAGLRNPPISFPQATFDFAMQEILQLNTSLNGLGTDLRPSPRQLFHFPRPVDPQVELCHDRRIHDPESNNISTSAELVSQSGDLSTNNGRTTSVEARNPPTSFPQATFDFAMQEILQLNTSRTGLGPQLRLSSPQLFHFPPGNPPLESERDQRNHEVTGRDQPPLPINVQHSQRTVEHAEGNSSPLQPTNAQHNRRLIEQPSLAEANSGHVRSSPLMWKEARQPMNSGSNTLHVPFSTPHRPSPAVHTSQPTFTPSPHTQPFAHSNAHPPQPFTHSDTQHVDPHVSSTHATSRCPFVSTISLLVPKSQNQTPFPAMESLQADCAAPRPLPNPPFHQSLRPDHTPFPPMESSQVDRAAPRPLPIPPFHQLLQPDQVPHVWPEPRYLSPQPPFPSFATQPSSETSRQPDVSLSSYATSLPVMWIEPSPPTLMQSTTRPDVNLPSSGHPLMPHPRPISSLRGEGTYSTNPPPLPHRTTRPNANSVVRPLPEPPTQQGNVTASTNPPTARLNGSTSQQSREGLPPPQNTPLPDLYPQGESPQKLTKNARRIFLVSATPTTRLSNWLLTSNIRHFPFKLSVGTGALTRTRKHTEWL
jgi:hypothetical protein